MLKAHVSIDPPIAFSSPTGFTTPYKVLAEHWLTTILLNYLCNTSARKRPNKQKELTPDVEKKKLNYESTSDGAVAPPPPH